MGKKIVIAAGGTGGHLYPGLALARELAGRGCEVVFMVRENDPCREIFERERFTFLEVPVRGMPRKLSLKLLSFTYFLGKGLTRTAALLRQVRPDAVVGMGGYISFPVVLMARLQGIPAVVHEQNYIPGLANRLLFRVVDRAALSYDDTVRYTRPGTGTVTGNPVRRELFGLDPKEACYSFGLAPERFTVLVFGGSLGAAGINRAVTEALPLLQPLRERVQLIHLTGRKDFARVRQVYEREGMPAAVHEYSHEIGRAYAAADLVICRSGATTVAELAYLDTYAVFVPYPYATANHQEFNARPLERAGKATIILEKDLNGDRLAAIIAQRLQSFDGRRSAVPPPAALPQEVLASLVLSI